MNPLLQTILVSASIPFVVSLFSLVILKKRMWIAIFIDIFIIIILLSKSIFEYAPKNQSVTESIRIFLVNDSSMTLPFYILMLFFSIFFTLFFYIPILIKNNKF